MSRNHDVDKRGQGRLGRAASAVKRMFSRGSRTEESAPLEAAGTARDHVQRPEPQQAPRRTTTRRTDIPLDLLDKAYTPPLTSSKASFPNGRAPWRSTGRVMHWA